MTQQIIKNAKIEALPRAGKTPREIAGARVLVSAQAATSAVVPVSVSLTTCGI
jgi:hypothetical protein